MRLLSVPWRPRRSFGNASLYQVCSPAGEPRRARTFAAASDGFEARRSQRARAVMFKTQCITAYKLSSLSSSLLAD